MRKRPLTLPRLLLRQESARLKPMVTVRVLMSVWLIEVIRNGFYGAPAGE